MTGFNTTKTVDKLSNSKVSIIKPSVNDVKDALVEIGKYYLACNHIQLIILKDKKAENDWIDGLIELFATLGFITTGTTKEIWIIDFKEYLDNPNYMFLLDELTSKVNVLYDESGKYKDVSAVKNTEVQVDLNEKMINVNLEDENFLQQQHFLGEMKKHTYITSLYLLFGALQELTDPYHSNFRYMQAEKINNFVEGMSGGYIKDLLTDKDLINFTHAEQDDELIQSGHIFTTSCIHLYHSEQFHDHITDDQINKFWKVMYQIQDIAKIWKNALNLNGVPMNFSRFTEETKEVNVNNLKAIAKVLGIDVMLNAYYSGISLDDIIK